MTEAQNYIAILEKRGMNLASIAAATGRSRETMSRIKHGHKSGTRSIEQLKRLVNVLPSQLPTAAIVAPSRPDVAPIQQRIYEPPTRRATRRKVKKSQPGVSSIGLLLKGIFTRPTPAPQPTEHQRPRPFQEYNELPNVARRPRRI